MTSKNISARVDPYSYCISVRRVQVGEERLFKGTVAELPHVTTFEKSAEEAYSLAIEAIESLYESAIEDGRPFPVPHSHTESSEYSGRLTLRMPKWLHAQLDSHAEADGISLNQYLITILAASGSINALVREASETINRINVNANFEQSFGVAQVSGGLISMVPHVEVMGIPYGATISELRSNIVKQSHESNFWVAGSQTSSTLQTSSPFSFSEFTPSLPN